MFSKNGHDYELLYSPSRWCKRYKSSDECLKDHVRIITEESEIVRSSIPANLDVTYGSLPKEKYDLFGIDLPNESPIIFYVHGGYWQEECIGRQNSSFIAKVFQKQGIKSFIAGYELCPNVKLEEIILQIQKALRVCLDYAKRNGSRGICLMGHSAGAHLIAMLFSSFVSKLLPEEIDLLNSVFLVGGIYDLEPILITSYNNPIKLTPETAKQYSPINHRIADCDTTFFVVVGKYDSPAFVEQSELVEKKLKDQNRITRLIILDNFDHFNIIEQLSTEDFVLVQLIIESLQQRI